LATDIVDPREITAATPMLKVSGLERAADALAFGLFSVLAAAVTLANLGVHGQFIGFDAGPFAAVPAVGASQLTTWNEINAPGLSAVPALFLAPVLLPAAVLANLGLVPVLIQRLFFGGLVFAAGFSSYRLLATMLNLFAERTHGVAVITAPLLGALLYTFNPYSMLILTFPITGHDFAWALLPLGLLLLLKGLSVSRSYRLAVPLAIVWLVIGCSNPAFAILAPLVGAIVGGLYLLKRRSFSGRDIRFLVLSSMLIVLFGAYVWLPLTSLRGNPYAPMTALNSGELSTVTALEFSSSHASFLNVLRLTSDVNLYYQRYTGLLESDAPWVAAEIIIVVTVLSGMLFIRRDRSNLVLPLTILLLSFMFMAKGTHEPVSQPLSWVYTHVPGFYVFRSISDKFGLVMIFSMSMLLTLVLARAWTCRPLVRASSYSLLVVCIGIYALPFLAGWVVDPRYITDVPSDYVRLKNFLHESPGTIYSAPDYGGRLFYNWYEQNGAFDPIFLDTPGVSEQWLLGNGVDLDWQNPSQFAGEWDRVLDRLPLLGVRFIVVHKDVVAVFRERNGLEIPVGGPARAAEMVSGIDQRNDLRLVMSTAHFNLYEYKQDIVRTDVYATQNLSDGADFRTFVASADHPADTASPTDGFLTFVSRPPGISSAGTKVEGLAAGGRSPKVSVVHAPLSGSRVVRVSDASSSYALILLQTYDPNWQAFIDTSIAPPSINWVLRAALLGSRSAVPGHVVANGFGNAWSISRSGTYWVIMIYRPQAFFILGAALSVAAALCVGIWLLVATLVRVMYGVRRPTDEP
jgi:hypothetical protein